MDLSGILGKGSLGLAIASWCFVILFGYAGYSAIAIADYLIGFIFSVVAAGLLLIGIYFARKTDEEFF